MWVNHLQSVLIMALLTQWSSRQLLVIYLYIYLLTTHQCLQLMVNSLHLWSFGPYFLVSMFLFMHLSSVHLSNRKSFPMLRINTMCLPYSVMTFSYFLWYAFLFFLSLLDWVFHQNVRNISTGGRPTAGNICSSFGCLRKMIEKTDLDHRGVLKS